MGWKEYYFQTCPISFGEQRVSYDWFFKGLKRKYPKVLSLDQPLRLALGGFHPFNGTPEKFLALCQDLHPNPKDQHLLLDMNPLPISEAKYLGKKPGIELLVGDLTKPPLGPETIDILFLDCTLNFMSDEQIHQFSLVFPNCLSPQGIIIATIDEALFPNRLTKLMNSLKNRIETFSRKPEQLISLITASQQLKTITVVTSNDSPHNNFDLLAFALSNSPYCSYRGLPFAIRN